MASRIFCLAFVAICVANGAFGAFLISHPEITRAAGQQFDIEVATDGSGFLAVWSDTRTGDRALLATRVYADGTVLDPFGLVIARRGGETPDVTFDGSKYVVVWNDYGDLLATTVSLDGEIGERVRIGRGSEPQIASNGNGFLVAARGELGALRLIALSPVLGVVTTNNSAGTAMFEGPRVARLGLNYLVAWESPSGRERIVNAIRVDSAATASEPVVAATNAFRTRLAAHVNHVLLTWEEVPRNLGICEPVLPQKLGARIVSPGGMSETRFVIETAEPELGEFAAVATRVGFSIIWLKKSGEVNTRGGAFTALCTVPNPIQPTFDLYRTDLDLDGLVIRTDSLVVSDDTETHPAAASNGDAILTLWTDRDSGNGVIDAAIATAGHVQAVAIAKSATHQEEPQVAAAGDRYVVAWSEIVDGRYVVDARAVDASGRFASEVVRVSSGDGHSETPVVACYNENCLVAWRTLHGTEARRISNRGEIIDAVPIVLSEASSYARLAVAAGPEEFGVLHADGPTVVLSRIKESGSVSRQPLPLERATNVQYFSLAVDGAAFVAAWSRIETRWSIEAARIEREGTPVVASIGKSADDEMRPSVACSSSDCVIAWTVARPSGMEVATARFTDGVAATIRPQNIVTTAPIAARADVAAAGNRFVVSWLEIADGEAVA
ncbi:MAG TPA: hypothetical protein VF057_09545, partial [Thermoanaerobaculia bacterium]